MREQTALRTVALAFALALAGFGCTQASHDAGHPMTPTLRGPALDAGSAGDTQVAEIERGDDKFKILVHNIGGSLFHSVEGTFSPDSFDQLLLNTSTLPQSERAAALRREMDRVLSKIRGVRGMTVSRVDEVGYFSVMVPYEQDLMHAVKEIEFDHGVLLNPIVYNPEVLRDIKALTPASEGLVPRAGSGNIENFSGLNNVHAVEFAKKAAADIGGGAVVNGSSVKLGITDTGITMNHPTFQSRVQPGKNRIAYLRDFTREGRIYFNLASSFTAAAPQGGAAEDMKVSAQVIVTPKLPSLPAGDQFATLNDLPIKVSAELKALLLAPNASGAKLGVLLENSLQADSDPVDLNANGKKDDKLFAILIPGKTAKEDRLYFDAMGTADFRNSPALGDWNTTQLTMNVVAERFGFAIEDTLLPKSDGSGTMPVRGASIVGFDPGNHGSHVAGIAAGLKTIANAPDDTLARGVAPEATILLNRVCANNGGCNAAEAFIDLATNAGAEVINMSLGGLSPFNDGYGVEETMINRLTSLKNVLFVISAGNSGPGRQTIGSPSTARLSLSVGATASRSLIETQYQWPGASDPLSPGLTDDFMLFFSSRGPTASGGFKPNVTTPGTELSSIQLNAAPGAHAGLDVYWGTSMAAPTATGSYALFLDGVKKYNVKNVDKPLASDAVTLRRVLIESARAFDAATFDPSTGKKTDGQYTWADEGKGMLDLTAAWAKLFELRDAKVDSAVHDGKGNPVELDYQVLVPSTAPNGIVYDGSRIGSPGTPAFGDGLYIDPSGTDSLLPVHVARRLPERFTGSPEAGDLTRQLVTTADEFMLKTVIHGSDRNWVRAGVLDQLDCANSPKKNLTLVGRAAEVKMNDDGSGTLVPYPASVLNVCIDRKMIAEDLPAGDNGALISAHRVVNGVVSPVASFVVPVYVSIPNRKLSGATAYLVDRTVDSFGVSRNYVQVPANTNVVRVTLEVPTLQPGESCSGVELMALKGGNTFTAYKTRKEARVSNCDANGRPLTDKSARVLSFSETGPKAGIWDIHVFGSYKYRQSKYRLRVDYILASSSVSKIEGGLAALNGSLVWTVKESSLDLKPAADKSAFAIKSLQNTAISKVAKGESVVVPMALGQLQAFSAEVQSVTVSTGGSSGNDIDLEILECQASATSPADPSCSPITGSGGPTDEETATFSPRAGKVYGVQVDGYDIKNDGRFTVTELISFPTEKGQLIISGDGPAFKIAYAMPADQLATSTLAKSPLFTSGACSIVGSLELRAPDGTLLDSFPVKVTNTTP